MRTASEGDPCQPGAQRMKAAAPHRPVRLARIPRKESRRPLPLSSGVPAAQISMVIDYIKELDRQYYMGVFGDRFPAAFVRGQDMRLYDTMGNSYKDFLAGIAVNALGYSDEGFKHAIKDQVDMLIHTSNYFYNEEQALLAQDLCVKTNYDKVFLANSGAEANECAAKLAYKRANDRGIKNPNFVALKHSFHGRTLATLAVTGKDGIQDDYQPPVLEVRFLESDDVGSVEKTIDENTCGALIEVIQGEGGVFPLSAMFVKAIESRCREVGAVFIIDEVQTGMGRTGRFLAQEYCGVKANVTTLAKSLGNGMPIGACLAEAEFAETFGPGDHGSTFGGNHLACVAARYMCKIIDDKMLSDITDIGETFKYQLFTLKSAHENKVKDIRGLGLMLGMELHPPLEAAKVARTLFDLGYIVGTSGSNTLRFLPPYIVREDDIKELMGALDYVLGQKG